MDDYLTYCCSVRESFSQSGSNIDECDFINYIMQGLTAEYDAFRVPGKYDNYSAFSKALLEAEAELRHAKKANMTDTKVSIRSRSIKAERISSDRVARVEIELGELKKEFKAFKTNSAGRMSQLENMMKLMRLLKPTDTDLATGKTKMKEEQHCKTRPLTQKERMNATDLLLDHGCTTVQDQLAAMKLNVEQMVVEVARTRFDRDMVLADQESFQSQIKTLEKNLEQMQKLVSDTEQQRDSVNVHRSDLETHIQAIEKELHLAQLERNDLALELTMIKEDYAAMEVEREELGSKLKAARDELQDTHDQLLLSEAAAVDMRDYFELAAERCDVMATQLENLEAKQSAMRADHEAETAEWKSIQDKMTDDYLKTSQALKITEAALAGLKAGSDVVVKKADWESMTARLDALEKDAWEHC